MIFLSKVEDAFQISGHGCVVVAAVSRSNLKVRLHVRDSIQLRIPDGSVLDTYVAGIEIVCGPEARDNLAFLLPEDISKQGVPAGTEIWLIQERCP
jgi:hypothetical protein